LLAEELLNKQLGVDLPEDFQKSEFLLKNGAIDMIVHRKNIRSKVHGLLKKYINLNEY